MKTLIRRKGGALTARYEYDHTRRDKAVEIGYRYFCISPITALKMVQKPKCIINMTWSIIKKRWE